MGNTDTWEYEVGSHLAKDELKEILDQVIFRNELGGMLVRFEHSDGVIRLTFEKT